MKLILIKAETNFPISGKAEYWTDLNLHTLSGREAKLFLQNKLRMSLKLWLANLVPQIEMLQK